MISARIGIALAAFLALAACGEKPQDTTAVKKGSAPAWQGTVNGNAVPGWKAGDEQSWEEQMRRRAQSQNEYLRTAGQS